jgi:hypothetical protein
MTRLIDIELVFLRQCRSCQTVFETRLPDRGTKWTQLCDACLRGET